MRIFHFASLVFAFLLLPLVIVGQDPHPAPLTGASALPPLPQDAKEIFAAAAPLYDFSSPKLQPWHMKVSYQLYDEKSQPSEKGTYEYWWASPETYRSTWSRAGVEQTDWHVGGQRYHRESGGSLTYSERKLESDLLQPLPTADKLDPQRVRFEKREQDFGAVKLPCVTVVRQMPMSSEIPTGMFPTFCFDSRSPMLRANYTFGGFSAIYNKIARMQAMLLPHELTIYDGKLRVLTASVDTVDNISPTAAEFTPEAGQSPTPEANYVAISSELALGQKLKSVAPRYPAEAKRAHEHGTVFLKAIIGGDGRIHDLSVVSGPSPSLVAAAMVAVAQWQYKPYMLKGVPVDVSTTIKVIFGLGD